MLAWNIKCFKKAIIYLASAFLPSFNIYIFPPAQIIKGATKKRDAVVGSIDFPCVFVCGK